MNNGTATNVSIDTRGPGPTGSTGLVLQDTYTLRACIGRGGRGEVYEATHARLPGRFAVKILRPRLLTNVDAFARFCREAEIMSALRHPHIIQIFDFSTSRDGRPYFVMEYLDGVDLKARLAHSGALPLPVLVRIVEAAASALGAAHAAGIVHRDLEPASIFLMRGEGQDDDFVKVLGFAISDAGEEGPRSSRAFMAPEQALGLAGQVDARSDQFALAAIAYTMLTGREPFAGGHEQPPLLSKLLAWDTREIQSVLNRALAKRPEDRFDTIVEFAWALRAAAHSAMHGRARSAPIAGRSPPLPPIQLTRAMSAPPRPGEPHVQAEQPRALERVPHGPQRAVALGLTVLVLAAAIVHQRWYRGVAGRAANLGQQVASVVRRGQTIARPDQAPSETQRPAFAPAPSD